MSDTLSFFISFSLPARYNAIHSVLAHSLFPSRVVLRTYSPFITLAFAPYISHPVFPLSHVSFPLHPTHAARRKSIAAYFPPRLSLPIVSYSLSDLVFIICARSAFASLRRSSDFLIYPPSFALLRYSRVRAR